MSFISFMLPTVGEEGEIIFSFKKHKMKSKVEDGEKREIKKLNFSFFARYTIV